MSNQFSYELDERQIRIMLQDGEAEYDASAWNRFEQLAKPDIKPASKSFSPKFNISISRSVVVPLIFVVLIGGLSATLFSFVDFKKKEVPVTKHTPEQQTEVQPAMIEKAATPAQPKQEAVATSTEHQQVLNPSSTPSVAVQQTILTQKPNTEKIPAKPEDKPLATAVVKSSQASVQTVTSQTNATKGAVQPIVRRKKTKETSEAIPTINTSSTMLNQGNTEPELDLK